MCRAPGDPQQAPLAALARLHAYQTAHIAGLRKALGDHAPLEVVKPLTAEALALLSTAKLLKKVRMMPWHHVTGLHPDSSCQCIHCLSCSLISSAVHQLQHEQGPATLHKHCIYLTLSFPAIRKA